MEKEELKKLLKKFSNKQDPSEFQICVVNRLSSILKEDDWELEDLLEYDDINGVLDYFKEEFEENRNPEYRGFSEE